MNSRRLKIALVCGWVRCDRNRTQYQRVRFLAKKAGVFVVASHSVCADLIPKLRMVRTCPGSSMRLDRAIYPLWAILMILRLRLHHRIDVVLTTPYRPALFVGFLAHGLRIPWVADIWDDPALGWQILRGRKGLVNRLRRSYRRLQLMAVRPMLRRADLAVSVIPEVLRASYGVSRQRLLGVTNGVDLRWTDPRRHSGSGTISEGFTAVYVGPIMKLRGVDLLLEATARLRNAIPDFRLQLIGPVGRGDARWLRDMTEKLDISSCVDAVGLLPHAKVLAEYAHADVCLSPLPQSEIANYTYACPIKILEYLAMGKAVIATDLPGSRRLIEHGVNGLLVRPGVVDDLVQAVLRIWTDAGLRGRLERAARKSVMSYEWDAINSTVYKRIHSLVTGHAV